jgi:hypothetical protein
MLVDLQWPTLSDRRRKAHLKTFYPFHRGNVVINTTRKPTPQPPTRSTGKTHPAAYQLPSCRTAYRKQSFFSCTIAEWNSLPAEVALSPTVEGFKSRI